MVCFDGTEHLGTIEYAHATLVSSATGLTDVKWHISSYRNVSSCAPEQKWFVFWQCQRAHFSKSVQNVLIGVKVAVYSKNAFLFCFLLNRRLNILRKRLFEADLAISCLIADAYWLDPEQLASSLEFEELVDMYLWVICWCRYVLFSRVGWAWSLNAWR